MSEFTEYCLSFYGPRGIYKLGFTASEIKLATKLYITMLEKDNREFYGDTVDREAVRDLILDAKEQLF